MTYAEDKAGAVAFIGAATKHLPATDIWGILYPSLRHHLRSEIHEVDASSISMTLRSSVCLKRIYYSYAFLSMHTLLASKTDI